MLNIVKKNRRIGILLLFAFLSVLSFFYSLSSGSVEVSFFDLWNAWQGDNGMKAGIINNIRLPRTIIAALVGINLSLSGAILQGVMKNPLADPHIIGISSGAGLLGIMVMLILPGYDYLVTPAAFLGAMLAAACIYILAWKNGIRPLRIILAGVAVSAFLGAGISGLLIFYSDRVHNALLWMVGGLSARSWIHVYQLYPYTILGTILAFFSAPYLNILQLGDDSAKSLGVRVEAARLFLTAVAALLAASAVAVVGLLGFVGLIVPHTARMLIGSDHKMLLPASALLGISIVLCSDTFARTCLAPVELPVGIIMAVLGAPFFLFLLRREI